MNPQRFLHGRYVASCLLLIGLSATTAFAEILNSSTPQLRIRLGANGTGATETVIYSAGIPSSMGGLLGVTADGDTESTNVIGGGNNPFTVRIVTDVNARNGAATLTGTFVYDSSTPMQCITPLSCGTQTLSFNKVRWRARDGDTLNSVLQYDASAAQVFQVQTDSNPLNNQAQTRHRNHYQFIYINDVLMPAGTYEGEIEARGSTQ